MKKLSCIHILCSSEPSTVCNCLTRAAILNELPAEDDEDGYGTTDPRKGNS